MRVLAIVVVGFLLSGCYVHSGQNVNRLDRQQFEQNEKLRATMNELAADLERLDAKVRALQEHRK